MSDEARQDEPSPSAPAPVADEHASAPATPVETPNADLSRLAKMSIEELLTGAPPIMADGSTPAAVVEDTPSDGVTDTPSDEVVHEEVKETKTPEPAKTDDSEGFDPALVERVIEENRQLIRLKGKMGQEKGEQAQEIARLNERIRALEDGRGGKELVDETDDANTDLATKLLADTRGTLRAEIEAIEQERAARAEAEAASDRIEVTPIAGFQLFAIKHDIKNVNGWVAGEEGQAVTRIVQGDPILLRALQASALGGDAEGVAQVLSRAMKLHTAGKHAATAKQTLAKERERVEAAKPRSTPRSAGSITSAAPKGLKDLKAADILNMSDAEFRRVVSR